MPQDQEATRIVHPIARAWVSRGGTGAQNYDEFADEAEIESILAAHPASILSVDMPHCTPADRAAGRGFGDALPAARQRLTALESDGHFVASEDIAVAYRITGQAGTAYGLLAMVDTEQISASAGEPGRVIRNEEVFSGKVHERMALTAQLGQLISAVLLVQADRGAELAEELRSTVDGAGPPDVVDTDQHGQEHAMWLLRAGERRDRLLALAGDGDLVVADGNHRTLAAQEGGLPRFLAVVTSPDSVRLRPYNRLVRYLPTAFDPALDALRATGCVVARLESLAAPERQGQVVLYAGPARAYDVTLPASAAGELVDRLDHAVVERLVLAGALGLDPGDTRIGPIGGDYSAQWLQSEVDSGRAALAVLIAPVTVEDFLAVNLARQTMPRKSTWFVPKVRAGLVLAEL